jgi:hypothetical protein
MTLVMVLYTPLILYFGKLSLHGVAPFYIFPVMIIGDVCFPCIFLMIPEIVTSYVFYDAHLEALSCSVVFVAPKFLMMLN